MEATIIMSLNSTPSGNFWKESFMHYYCRTHSEAATLLHPLLAACLWPGSCLCLFFILYRRGITSLVGQSGWELTGQEITCPSKHLCQPLSALSPTQNLWVFFSQLPDVHLFRIFLNFTALSCSQSSQGRQCPGTGWDEAGTCTMKYPHTSAPGLLSL